MDAEWAPATSVARRPTNGRVSLLFDFFSLDIIYYPVSWIMWVWYKLFASVLGPSNFFAWALSVMFLVFTLRALLYKPFVRQIRTTRQMQELQPQIKALQKKYGKDRQRMALEMQKLQREHGFNPILGCLPMLAQIPVFLGLYHVLRSFNRTTGGFGQPHLSVAQNRATGNYVFTPADVAHFLDANLFGAPIGAFMTQHSGLDAFTHFSRPAVIAVGAPVMILAGVATYFNSRASVARQSAEAAANPQTAMMNKLALYVFPLGVVVGGPFLPVAIILYWFANNIWTFGQQHYVFGMIEKEEEAKRQEAIARRAANAPAPGAKPKRNPKAAPSAGNGSSTADDGDGAPVGEPAASDNGSDGDAAGTKTGKAQPQNSETAGPNTAATNRTPRPGARPKKRKR
jgi:YidC/Oxa1 family membrane protein insertase